VVPSPAAAQFRMPPLRLDPSPGGSVAGDRMAEMERLAKLAKEREEDLEQTFVVPERPGQNQVAWYDFEWHRYDVPAPGGPANGIRLYYYSREKAVVERALPVIRNAYARLIDQFHYTPTKPIPYILYSSHREFQTTNLFQISESVLGVTSPRDLKMSLPYFGDHEKFREVSMHELVHQFTIQKLLDVAGAEQLSSPVESLPLWFIEGIAEYYTKGGIDTETDLYLRDLLWNPDPEKHYDIIPFAEDRLRGFIPTYKLGQARVAFIADVYGKEKIQHYLENAYLLGGSASGGGADRGFAALTRRVLNEPIEQVDARWRTWVKRRYYPQYMEVKHDLPSVREVQELPDELEAFVASTDGQLIFYRGIDRERGRARLYLADVRHPKGAEEVVADNVPGVESLHPIERNVLALSGNTLAFAAQKGAGDALYVQRFRHIQPEKGGPPKIDLERRREVEFKSSGARILEISDPTLSKDGSHLAFVGLTEAGQQDVFVVPIDGGVARQVTDDPHSERDLAWGPDGIYCTSDATDHGKLNLFRIDVATGQRTRLTTAPATFRHPRPQPDGSLLFTSDAGGKPDLYLLKEGATRQLTDFATGLGSPHFSANGKGIYATTFYRGQFRLVEVPRVAWLETKPVPVEAVDRPALPIPREPIPQDTPRYNAYSISNWRPEAGIVYGGGAQNAVAGRAALLFSELLRDHLLYIDLAVYGSFDLTQALVLFEDRSRRTSLVLGAYHTVEFQFDRTFDDSTLYFLQRDYGAVGALRYPLDRFRRFELELSLGAVERYCLTDTGDFRTILCGGGRLAGVTEIWRKKNVGTQPVATPVLRFGYDTVRYDPFTGPVAGSSSLLEVGGGYLPTREAVHGFARTDLATYWPIVGRSNFMLRLAGGTSFAPNRDSLIWSKVWWLSSADNLRGFSPFDFSQLIGQHFYVLNAELQIPLDPLIRLLIFDYLEGVAALDFGGVFNKLESRKGYRCPTPDTCGDYLLELGAWDSRTLTGVLGVNVLFGPLLLRVHFGHPFDIGGQETPAMRAGTDWVTNVTLRYFFF
jgi:Tol biopolymer transport system component